MRYLFLLTFLISCASSLNTKTQVSNSETATIVPKPISVSENPEKLEYKMTPDEMKVWLKAMVSAIDRSRSTDFLEKENIEIITGPEALRLLKTHNESISSFEKKLLKRSDSKVVYLRVERGTMFPAGFLLIFPPENLRSDTRKILSTHTLGVKNLRWKEFKKVVPDLVLPEFEGIPSTGLFAIIPVSKTYRPLFGTLSQAQVPMDGSFVSFIGKSKSGRAFLKPFVGDFRTNSILVFRDGKLIDYVASCRSEQSVRHLMFRNGFITEYPGLSVRWKIEMDPKDLLRALSWSTDLSASDLTDMDLRGAFFSKLFFSGTDFSNSDLRGANFNGARLNYTNFKGANLKGATFEGAIWGNTICPDGSLSDDLDRYLSLIGLTEPR